MDPLSFLHAAVTGLLIGGIYGVITVGFDVLYGVLELVNFAHGEIIMLAMYCTLFLSSFFGINLALLFLAVPAIFLFIAVFLFFGIYKVAIGKSREWTVLYTASFSIVLQNLALVLWSSDPRQYWNPLKETTMILGPLNINLALLTAFISSLVLFAIVYFVIYKTETGILIRATVNNRQLVSLLGIDPYKIYFKAFCFAILLTSIGGILLAVYFPIFPTVGSVYQLFIIVAVVFGGSGSIKGSLVGGLFIGITQTLSALTLPVNFQNVIVFIIFIITIVLKPRGLFGK